MNIVTVALLASLAALPVRAEKSWLIACVEQDKAAHQIAEAVAVAERIFSAIGISIHWQRPLGACPPEGIQIRLADRVPPETGRNVLGVSLPYQGRVDLYYRRIAGKYQPYMVGTVMGHVLAHEIAHSLQGINRHSATGVMSAHWQRADFVLMLRQQLCFTARDVDLIYEGLKRRQ